MKFKISIIIKFFFISCECVRIKYSNQSKFKLELKKLQCKFEKFRSTRIYEDTKIK